MLLVFAALIFSQGLAQSGAADGLGKRLDLTCRYNRAEILRVF